MSDVVWAELETCDYKQFEIKKMRREIKSLHQIRTLFVVTRKPPYTFADRDFNTIGEAEQYVDEKLESHDAGKD